MDLSLYLYNPRSESLLLFLSLSLSHSHTHTHKRTHTHTNKCTQRFAMNALRSTAPSPPDSHFTKPQLTALWFNWPQLHWGSTETNY